MSKLGVDQEYQFNAGDYNLMRFNPTILAKGEKPLEKFPILARFVSFTRIQEEFPYDANKIIKYILYCYDPNSPAVIQIPDIFKRKSWCGHAAGFSIDPETTVFKVKYYDILNCEIETINYAIIDFCSLFGSVTYMSLVTGYESLYRKQRTMSQDIDDSVKKTVLDLEKVRGELWKQIQTLQKDIQELEYQYLNDRNTYLVKNLYRLVNEDVYKRLQLTPESRAFNS